MTQLAAAGIDLLTPIPALGRIAGVVQYRVTLREAPYLKIAHEE